MPERFLKFINRFKKAMVVSACAFFVFLIGAFAVSLFFIQKNIEVTGEIINTTNTQYSNIAGFYEGGTYKIYVKFKVVEYVSTDSSTSRSLVQYQAGLEYAQCDETNHGSYFYYSTDNDKDNDRDYIYFTFKNNSTNEKYEFKKKYETKGTGWEESGLFDVLEGGTQGGNTLPDGTYNVTAKG